jgi:hypothetical protein
VTNDIEKVLRKIDYYHQGSIMGFKMMYGDSEQTWDGVLWDRHRAGFLRCARPTRNARVKLLGRE